MWCGLRLQRSAGLIQSREAAHDAMTGGEKKKVGESSGKGDPDGKTTGGKKATAAHEKENKFVFFPFFFARAAEDTEERRRGTGAGKISEGRVEGGRRGGYRREVGD